MQQLIDGYLFVIVVLVLNAARWVGGGGVVVAAALVTHIIGYRQVAARRVQRHADRTR